MISLLLLAQSTSVVIDTTRWLEPYEVRFECQMVGVADSSPVRLVARAQIAEGAEGSQPVRLLIDGESGFQPGAVLSLGQSASSSSRLRLSNDEFEIELPWRLSGGVGSPSYPEVAAVFARDGDAVSMAGPCIVTNNGGVE